MSFVIFLLQTLTKCLLLKYNFKSLFAIFINNYIFLQLKLFIFLNKNTFIENKFNVFFQIL